MKSNIFKLFPLMLVPFLVACDGGGLVVLYDKTTSIMSTSTTTGSKIYLSTQKTNGDIMYKATIDENKSLTISTDVKVQMGAITLSILSMEDEQLFQEIVVDDMNFDFTLSDYGDYKINIIHDDFKGSYTIKWSK